MSRLISFILADLYSNLSSMNGIICIVDRDVKQSINQSKQKFETCVYRKSRRYSRDTTWPLKQQSIFQRERGSKDDPTLRKSRYMYIGRLYTESQWVDFRPSDNPTSYCLSKLILIYFPMMTRIHGGKNSLEFVPCSWFDYLERLSANWI